MFVIIAIYLLYARSTCAVWQPSAGMGSCSASESGRTLCTDGRYSDLLPLSAPSHRQSQQ